MQLNSVMFFLVKHMLHSAREIFGTLVLPLTLTLGSSLASAGTGDKSTLPNFRDLKSSAVPLADKERRENRLQKSAGRSPLITEAQLHSLISSGYAVKNNRLVDLHFQEEPPARVKEIDPHFLEFPQPTVAELKEYIFTKTDPEAIARMGAEFEIYADLLAHKIDVVTRCFDIDPWIFAAMIFQESKFDPKECYRGGCGLTQFTTDGIEGVEQVIDNYTEAIRCTDVSQFTTRRWIHLRDRHGLGTTSLRRRAMQHDTNAALVYGAIYLKLQMDELGFPTRYRNLRSYYESALRDYNGNKRRVRGVQIRDHYKKAILRYAEAAVSEIRGV